MLQIGNRTILVVSVSAIILAVGYNSCGQNKSLPQIAQMSGEALREELKKVIDPERYSEVCQNSDNYYCREKVFAPDVGEAETPASFPCLKMNDGTELCPEGSVRTYNSGRAQDQCENCSSSEKESYYRFSEVHCVNRAESLHGVHPIASEREDYESALKEAYRYCQEVFGETNE